MSADGGVLVDVQCRYTMPSGRKGEAKGWRRFFCLFFSSCHEKDEFYFPAVSLLEQILAAMVQTCCAVAQSVRLCDPMGLEPARLLCPWTSQASILSGAALSWRRRPSSSNGKKKKKSDLRNQIGWGSRVGGPREGETLCTLQHYAKIPSCLNLLFSQGRQNLQT